MLAALPGTELRELLPIAIEPGIQLIIPVDPGIRQKNSVFIQSARSFEPSGKSHSRISPHDC